MEKKIQDLINTNKNIFDEEKKKIINQMKGQDSSDLYYSLNALKNRCHYHSIEGYNNVLNILNNFSQNGVDKTKLIKELQDWLLYIYDEKFNKNYYVDKIDLDYVLDVVRYYSRCKLLDASSFVIFLNRNKNLQKLFPYESIPYYSLNHTCFLVDALDKNNDTKEIQYWCDSMFLNKKQEIYKFSDGRNMFDVLLSRYLNMNNRNEKVENFLISLYDKYEKYIKSSTYPKENKSKTNILKDMFLSTYYRQTMTLFLSNRIIIDKNKQEKALRLKKEYKEKIENINNSLDKKLLKIQLFKNVFPAYYNLCHKTMGHSDFLKVSEISGLFSVLRELKGIKEAGVFFHKTQLIIDLLDIKSNYNKNYTSIMLKTTCIAITKTYTISDINDFNSHKRYCLDVLDFIYSQPLCHKQEYLLSLEEWAKKTMETDKKVTNFRDGQMIEICQNALNFTEKEKINLSLQQVHMNTQKPNVKKIQKI